MKLAVDSCKQYKCNLVEISGMITIIFSLLGVGLLWGATNPFIRRGSIGIDTIDTGSRWHNLWAELRMIGSRLNYWIPFILNQLGSVLYVWTLQHTNITLAVPIANSLSFAFTAVTGYCLGERLPGKSVLIGTLMVCFGTTLMLYDKVRSEGKA
ncbi:transmembrane protein 234 homolog [Bactrocera dorsalis]|uniref:Transmembrane protein 234 homolog n=1 Tax=Bactrocera dorsalis TaxID=27457 RepID=A0A6I9V4N9_BACDO|nr:transmembrane protein 234 homolog [Bactrocera dorsalis]